MQEYDIALKVLLRTSTPSVLRQVSGEQVDHWLDTETPQVQISRADLLGVTAEGRLLHLELQSSNDPAMALRMAEYCLPIYREHKKFAKQIVLYVGNAPLRMEPSLSGPDLNFRYSLFDIRNLDGPALLASSRIQDNLLAVLTRLPERMDVVREILARIAKLEAHEMRAAFAQFLIISGLRKLEPAIREEAQKMPILNDILDHEVIGPAIRQGLQQGRRDILRRQLEKRFGPLPSAVATQLSALSEAQLDELALRLLDAPSLHELFPHQM